MNDQHLPAIHSDPDVMRGVPDFAGSRLPIRTLLACVDAGEDWDPTVKTLRRDADGKFFLEAAHPDYEPIRPKASLEILGVAVSVARRVRR